MKAQPDEEILSTLKSRSDSYKTDHRLSAQQALGCTSIFLCDVAISTSFGGVIVTIFPAEIILKSKGCCKIYLQIRRHLVVALAVIF